MRYKLSEDNLLLVTMEATTDEATPINLANHAYYNLAGHSAGSQALYDHFVTIRQPAFFSSQLNYLYHDIMIIPPAPGELRRMCWSGEVGTLQWTLT